MPATDTLFQFLEPLRLRYLDSPLPGWLRTAADPKGITFDALCGVFDAAILGAMFDLIRALNEQNAQFAPGKIGQPLHRLVHQLRRRLVSAGGIGRRGRKGYAHRGK